MAQVISKWTRCSMEIIGRDNKSKQLEGDVILDCQARLCCSKLRSWVFSFSFEIITDSWEVETNNTKRSHVPFPQFSAIVASYITWVPYPNWHTDIGTTCSSFLDFTSLSWIQPRTPQCTRQICVCVRFFFLGCNGFLYILRYKQPTPQLLEQFRIFPSPLRKPCTS